MKLGKTPRQFLAETDSAEIGELIAFYNLVADPDDSESGDVEDKLRKAFGKPK